MLTVFENERRGCFRKLGLSEEMETKEEKQENTEREKTESDLAWGITGDDKEESRERQTDENEQQRDIRIN